MGGNDQTKMQHWGVNEGPLLNDVVFLISDHSAVSSRLIFDLDAEQIGEKERDAHTETARQTERTKDGQKVKNRQRETDRQRHRPTGNRQTDK